MSSCTQEVGELTKPAEQTIKKSTPPAPKSNSCSKLNISIIDAEWAKPPFHQEPHKLRTTKADDGQTEYILGIDRSPDFFFKIETTEYYDVALVKGASRFLAYDCQDGTLQELDLSMEPDTELVDAQSGQIVDVTVTEDILHLKVRDYRTLKYKFGSNRKFIRLYS